MIRTEQLRDTSPCSLLRRAVRMLCVLSAVLLPCSSFADDFAEFKRSPEIRELTRDKRHRITGDDFGKWFPKNPNYSKVFIERDGPKLLLEWLSPSSTDYKQDKPVLLKSQELANASRTFRPVAHRDMKLKVHVLVPHPRSFLTRDMNLLNEFRNMEERHKRYPSHETIEVQGITASLGNDISGKEKSCSLLIPLPQKGEMEVSSENCLDTSILIEFTDTLDIRRLTDKLNS